MSTAPVLDHTPAAFRRALDGGQAAEGAQAATTLDDVADGVLALDISLTLAGFGYEARQLTLSVVGLVGGAGSRLEAYDAELAAHLNCSARTVRRWRAAHVKESRAKRFSLLLVEECEYNAGRKRYDRTAYSLNPAVATYVTAAVAGARASDLYGRDRRAAIERAAEEHYSDIPDAPPKQRRRRPRRPHAMRVEQAFFNAARNVEKGKQTLESLADNSRAALLESAQGEELRAMLLKIRADVGEVLNKFPQKNSPQSLDDAELDRRYRSNYPGSPGVRRSSEEASDRAEECEESPDWWEQTFRGLMTEPPVRSRLVELRPPEQRAGLLPPDGRREEADIANH